MRRNQPSWPGIAVRRTPSLRLANVPAIHDLALRHAARMTIGRNGQCCAVGKRWQLVFGTEGIEVEGESGGGENKGDHRVKAVAHARAYGPKRDIREE